MARAAKRHEVADGVARPSRVFAGRHVGESEADRPNGRSSGVLGWTHRNLTEDLVLPCRQYDRLAETDQAAVVEHKRLSHVLQVARAVQAQRDNGRIAKAPSRTHRGDSTKTNRNTPQTGKKKHRELTQADAAQVIVDPVRRRQAQPRKPSRRSTRAGGTDISALPVQDQLFDTA